MKEKQNNGNAKLKNALIVILILGYPIMFIAFANIYSKATTGASHYNPQALDICEAPYKDEQQKANIAEQYSAAIGYNASATFQALTDAANGLKSCQALYGNN